VRTGSTGNGCVNTSEDVVRDRDDIAATLKPLQRSNACAFLARGQSFAKPRTHASVRGFRQRQRGRDRPFTSTACSRSAATSALDSI
jgi:hypothetical protein